METLGEVRVFSQNDTELVRILASDLYGLSTPEELAKREWPEKMRFKERFRLRFFRWLKSKRSKGQISAPIDGRAVTKVLLFRYDALGDYITTTSILEWLTVAIPGVVIDVVGSYRNKTLLESDPRIRRVIAINPSHGYRPSWLRVRQLGREVDYDVVIAAVFTQMTKAAILTTLASKRALNVTIRHNDRSGIYGQVFHCQVPHLPAEHWAETMARVGPFAITPVVSVLPDTARPRIPLNAKAAHVVSQWLDQRDLRWEFRSEKARVILSDTMPVVDHSKRRYIVVNISAYSPNRQWKHETCVPVIKELRKHSPDIDILVSGAPNEFEDVEEIVALVNDNNVHAWKGSVTELVAMIAGAHMLISPDTATIHLAAATGVPCTVLFAELIKVAEWYPYGVEFRGVLSADPSTVNAIPAHVIVNAALELI
ncbi:MAG: glycosyltransferase family 9 protein [Candidatus Kapabacteria bacterium]|nr:glycosyltransferase family 9 protein [Candidatus Kapabacteria bacterium]MBP7094447.1 glycosyltransferase family 9 protein [Candidatus Kapabacteria bacterium]